MSLTVNNALVPGQTGSCRQSQGYKSNTSQNSSFWVNSNKSQTCPCNISIICWVDPGWNVCFMPGWNKVSQQLWSDGPLSQIKAGLSRKGTRKHTKPAILGKYALDIKYRLMEY